jgi:hypothetical protein
MLAGAESDRQSPLTGKCRDAASHAGPGPGLLLNGWEAASGLPSRACSDRRDWYCAEGPWNPARHASQSWAAAAGQHSW